MLLLLGCLFLQQTISLGMDNTVEVSGVTSSLEQGFLDDDTAEIVCFSNDYVNLFAVEETSHFILQANSTKPSFSFLSEKFIKTSLGTNGIVLPYQTVLLPAEFISINNNYSFPCEYYVFALRKIVI